MKKSVGIAVLLLALSGSMAYAQHMKVGWSTSAENDCPSSPLSMSDNSFACNGNTGENVLIGSLVAPPGLNQVVGGEFIVLYQTESANLPDWWRFDPAGCRAGAASLDMAFDPTRDDGICHNAWGLNAASGFSYQPDFPNAGFGRLTMVGAIASQYGQAWPVGTEWYVFRLMFSNTKTSGAGACGGCATPATFAFQYAEINNTAGTGTDCRLTEYAVATWHQGVGVVPARRATWGQVKSLYR